MSITWLPKQGSITEKNYTDFFSRTWPYHQVMGGMASSGGLTVYLVHGTNAGLALTCGRAVTWTTATDLEVELPSWSTSYVYLVTDTAGGGIVATDHRLVYYNTPTYIDNSLLIARCMTDADSVTSIEHLCNLRHPNLQAYPSGYGGLGLTIDIASSTENSTTSTSAVLVKQANVEYAGVYSFSIDLKCSDSIGNTATCEVYCASTGSSTPQLTFTDTNNVYTTNTGTITCSEADVVSIYLKISIGTKTAYADECSLTGAAFTPVAPSFLIE